jgi:replicative DNA helicase
MAEAQQGRVPPHSVEAEQSVLGGLLMDNHGWDGVAQALSESDFYCADHRLIYGAMAALVKAGKPADVVTVFEKLQGAGKAEEVGGMQYLNALALSVPSAANSRRYADIVRHHAQRRRLMRVANDLADEARTGCVDAEAMCEVLAGAMQQLLELQRDGADDWPRTIGSILPQWISDLEARARGETDAIPTGLFGVDRALAGGVRAGDLVVVAARPSMGKSAYTLKMMRAVAAAGPVLMCTLEDSAGMLVSRQVASTGRINLADVRTPQRAPESMWVQVADAAEQLMNLPIYIDDRAGIGLAQVVQKARFVQNHAGGLKMVVVDYLQLMEGRGETRSYELGHIAKGLKRIAKEMQCVVVLLSQLSREADKIDGPPRLDHLAESGAIEQAADIVGLLWRESRRKPKPDNKHKAQIEFVKNKNGPTDTVHLYFDGATQRFEDMAEEGGY